MVQRLTESFINTVKPGSYFEVKTKTTPVGTSSSGNIVIIGEASGGAKYDSEDLKENWFTPDQLDKVTSKYVSGNIVDAFTALSSPSSDADITGSANRIYIVKTNTGVQASAVMASSYGTLKDKNFGLAGNKYNYQVTEVDAEVTASHEGSVIGSFGAAVDSSFTFRGDGGAENVIAVVGSPANVGALITEIDTALPAGWSCVAGVAADTIKIEADSDASAHTKGYGKSIELIDSTPADLAKLGLTTGAYASSQEPSKQVDIKRVDTNTNEIFEIDADIALEVGYVGTTATLTIASGVLSTTITGGTGTALSINLAEHSTMKDLADYINAQTGYTASASVGSTQIPTSALDVVTGMGICSTGSSLKVGRIKKSLYEFKKIVGQSVVLDFTATATAGLPDDTSSPIYLTSGAKGATTAAEIVSAVTVLETIDVNYIVPLFSQDATADISDGTTDSSSTYTISAINTLVKNHVLKVSSAKFKKHRSAIVSVWGTYSEAKAEVSAMSNARIDVTMQKSSQVNSAGVITSFLPWYSAVIAAGMQMAGFYKSITNKAANVISFEDPSGFDSGSFGDVEGALEAGFLILEKEVNNNKWVSDQTSYGVDTNFVYNSMSVMYNVDLVSLDLAASYKTAFTGKSQADIDPSTALSFLASKMDAYKKQKLITASDDAPLGYKNAKVVINGPVMSLVVEVKPTGTIYFIPISIAVSQVSQSS